MTRFAAPAMRRSYWVSYEGCSAAASSSPTDTPLGARNNRAWMRDGMKVELCEGREVLEVVGEASYQDNLWRIVRGRHSPDGRVR
ncbi:MAG: hypothetical protein M3328_00905 [Chloroflexota bacterium]|nr:hypothetical protein [Chloroflexota bacterium]